MYDIHTYHRTIVSVAWSLVQNFDSGLGRSKI